MLRTPASCELTACARLLSAVPCSPACIAAFDCCFCWEPVRTRACRWTGSPLNRAAPCKMGRQPSEEQVFGHQQGSTSCAAGADAALGWASAFAAQVPLAVPSALLDVPFPLLPAASWRRLARAHCAARTARTAALPGPGPRSAAACLATHPARVGHRQHSICGKVALKRHSKSPQHVQCCLLWGLTLERWQSQTLVLHRLLQTSDPQRLHHGVSCRISQLERLRAAPAGRDTKSSGLAAADASC